ncbi:hypothetical protein B0T14DRAFT_333953 [Immersiella caudata]|uniref:Uncharacterized protein n=1 Tax=Immersiella caudata TaxID=314043 RepID=A0AA39TLH4_9PEZI|nr:hypothetical protein B0T14DRAFT_333953 [Immersiella caudata]
MDPATIASIVTLAVGAAIKIPDFNNSFKNILKSRKDLNDLQLLAEFCKDRLREFKAEINRLDIPPDLHRQTKSLIKYSRGVIQGLVDYNKKYGDSFWARCMHWAVAARRSRTEIFERRLQECALWVRIASATSFLLAYRGGCGRVPGVLELCQTRAQQLREDVVQAKAYWKKHPRRMEKYMAVAVKLGVFRRYWGLAHDPMFEVVKSELSTPAGTSLGLSSPEEPPPRQYWRGIPVAMAAGPMRRAPEEDTYEVGQEHGMYFAPPVIPMGPYFRYPAPVTGPWYAGQGYGTTSYVHDERQPPGHGQQRPLTPGSASEETPQRSEPMMTPAVTRPAAEPPNESRPIRSSTKDDQSPSRESRRRHIYEESRSTNRDSASRQPRSSRHPESSRRPDTSRRPESSRRPGSSRRRTGRDDNEDRESRYSRSSSQRSHTHRSEPHSDDDHVHSSRSSSLVSSIRDSIFSRTQSLSSRSSYVSMRSSEHSGRTERSRQSSRSSSVEAASLEPRRKRGADRRCPPNSAMNETKARERIRRAEQKSQSTSSGSAYTSEGRGRASRREERRR